MTFSTAAADGRLIGGIGNDTLFGGTGFTLNGGDGIDFNGNDGGAKLTGGGARQFPGGC
jgi:hypothetical protein